jgi:hypothetical protein
MKKQNAWDLPLSPIERERLKPACAAYGVNPENYTSDAALCQAISEAVLAWFAAEQNPEAGYYDI